MATKKKLLQAAAGNAGGAALNVDEVFSTYLYEGNGSQNLTVTNGIDLAGEGGMVWYRRRDAAENNSIEDTERGLDNVIYTDSSNAEADPGLYGLQAFNSDGFTAGYDTSGGDYASWTFRKAPKFFDVVTYTGNGTNGREIAHNLGTTVGTVIIKCTSGTGSWQVWHREGAGSGTSSSGQLDSTAAFNNALVQYYFGDDTQKIDPTSTVFTVSDHSAVNASGSTYVAYLFAHNDGDGDFGPDADADAIKCGSFTPPSSGEQEVTLGFEPQFIITFDTGGGDNWRMYDTMRGWDVVNRQLLNPNESAAESSLSNTGGYEIKPTATGFIHEGHTASSPHIYIAIRRPTAVPESATEVFDVALRSATSAYSVGFPTDLWIGKETTRTNGSFVSDRLRGGTKYLLTPTTGAEQTDAGGIAVFDLQDSFSQGAASQPLVNWNWKRAPKYFDVVAYTGTGSDLSLQHNLGVAPEMAWVKRRNLGTGWVVGVPALSNTAYGFLNDTDAFVTSGGNAYFQNTAWSDQYLYLRNDQDVNKSGSTYIAYLFATLAGVSKVGSYTGSASDQTIDCGFSSGARFVLIKNVSALQGWAVFDTERGIVAGNDPVLFLNATDAEFTGADYIDPHSSGFTLVGGKTLTNNVTYEYIFYAIA